MVNHQLSCQRHQMNQGTFVTLRKSGQGPWELVSDLEREFQDIENADQLLDRIHRAAIMNQIKGIGLQFGDKVFLFV